MCRRVTCECCGKPTYAGCGAHIEQVLGDVPVSERCRCRESPERDGEAHVQPARPKRAGKSWKFW
jgi:hypothetical protein